MSTLKFVLPLCLALAPCVFSGCAKSQADVAEAPVKEAAEAVQNVAENAEQTNVAQGNAKPEGSVVTNGGAEIKLADLQYCTLDENAPKVFYLADINPDSIIKVYDAMQWTPTGKVAVKISTGEPPASNYLDPQLIAPVVKKVNGSFVECNTAYNGSRAETAMHYQVAKDHGFTDVAKLQILDEDGDMTLPVDGGACLKENLVGKAFADYDSYLVLSHFKGHQMAGFGGAIKNISIGLGSSKGKNLIHTGGKGGNMFAADQNEFCDSMADAGKSVSDYLDKGKKIVYVNIMNRLSIDCDCNGHPAEPDMRDVGVLASTDPVALDQACIDLVWNTEGNETFVERVNQQNGLRTLETAQKIGLGSRAYRLIDLGK